ncbi:MAG: hypothetical protein K9J37_01280 [Saprospiraceae bacterium]|nr:hypothetical protein [Saprospiraceae bacterium]MCF8248508.1 hypothetical protein [Saprospiraceae bacterium]MCF8280579.1 hypothetical protein [Bacteroidales bacterium]MCF8310242.1 hypothetical protein [Saprospiraceae bacterium]MCF8439319.1 hypothetical protein [Saprospiraceae bacterium]
MSKSLTINYLYLAAWIFLAPTLCQGQTASAPVKAKKQALFDLFKTDKITELTITADYDSIMANIRNKEYVFGEFEIIHSRKKSTIVPLRLRVRGKSRRMMCDFPPLKLKFDKDALDSLRIEKFNDFKLVTHCLEGQKAEVNIMREYLTYQLFNIITPYSFKASLAKITYKNTGKSFKKSTHLGVIIEDAESMAHRNHGENLEKQVINLDSLHLEQEKLTSVFQYMIGNTDWSYMMARNVELVETEDGKIVPVPYDFDYAGLVAAPYARANEFLGQRTVLDRVFLGNATTYKELQGIFSYFLEKKEAIFQAIDEFDELDIAVRKEMMAYLEGFFKMIKDKDRVENEMLAGVKKG